MKDRYINPFTDFGFKSLQVYRDLKISIDTAREEGRIEGWMEGRVEGEVIGEERGIVYLWERGNLNMNVRKDAMP